MGGRLQPAASFLRGRCLFSHQDVAQDVGLNRDLHAGSPRPCGPWTEAQVEVASICLPNSNPNSSVSWVTGGDGTNRKDARHP